MLRLIRDLVRGDEDAPGRARDLLAQQKLEQVIRAKERQAQQQGGGHQDNGPDHQRGNRE